MHPKLHVRFGGRAGETHQLKSRKGAPVRPYTYIRTRQGFLYLAFVLEPGIPPSGRRLCGTTHESLARR